MNKKQKKALVNNRHFNQRVSKKINGLISHVYGSDTDGLAGIYDVTHEAIVNMNAVHRLTIKELECMLNMDVMTREGYRQELVTILETELMGRRLLGKA